jgi:hypothetical protein
VEVFGGWWYARVNENYCVVRLMGSERSLIDNTLCYSRELADIDSWSFARQYFVGWHCVDRKSFRYGTKFMTYDTMWHHFPKTMVYVFSMNLHDIISSLPQVHVFDVPRSLEQVQCV